MQTWYTYYLLNYRLLKSNISTLDSEKKMNSISASSFWNMSHYRKWYPCTFFPSKRNLRNLKDNDPKFYNLSDLSTSRLIFFKNTTLIFQKSILWVVSTKISISGKALSYIFQVFLILNFETLWLCFSHCWVFEIRLFTFCLPFFHISFLSS